VYFRFTLDSGHFRRRNERVGYAYDRGAGSQWLGGRAALWFGCASGHSRPIIERLNKELRTVLASDDIRDRFATVGAEPLSSTPDEYAADIDREDAKWSALVKLLGLKAE
jgi:hypothetical protein